MMQSVSVTYYIRVVVLLYNTSWVSYLNKSKASKSSRTFKRFNQIVQQAMT